jgi:hypothetical protein
VSGSNATSALSTWTVSSQTTTPASSPKPDPKSSPGIGSDQRSLFAAAP